MARGTVYQRKGVSTWTLVYDEGRDETGKRTQRSRGGFRTQKEAQAALNKILHSMDLQTYVQPSKTYFRDYLDQWLTAVEPTIRPMTYVTYSTIVRNYIRPHLGGTQLQAITPLAIDAMYAKLRAKGKSPGTVRLTHGVLHRCLRDAVKKGFLVRNPVDQTDAPPKAETTAKTWTATELRRFLEYVKDDRFYALYLLAATTGMRRGELVGLRWFNLDLEAGRLSVVQTLLPTLAFGPPKTKAGRADDRA